MPLIYQQWITREDLRANPDKVYVFGDNIERRGYGGQAKEMRGEPNAIGVATKHAPSMAPNAFFDDTIECQVIVLRDLKKVQDALDAGKVVVVPADGIGTGLSRLNTTAPNLDRFIKKWFSDRKKR
ncbi:UNVERIFIED_ORG: 5-methylthioribose kinase [Bradyrhizobium japonicum]